MLKIEFQYVSKCPIVKEMEANIKTALSEIEYDTEYFEKILVNTEEDIKTRGSHTLLVNGRDLIGKVECGAKHTFCRSYNDGIPTVEEIKKFMQLNL